MNNKYQVQQQQESKQNQYQQQQPQQYEQLQQQQYTQNEQQQLFNNNQTEQLQQIWCRINGCHETFFTYTELLKHIDIKHHNFNVKHHNFNIESKFKIIPIL